MTTIETAALAFAAAKRAVAAYVAPPVPAQMCQVVDCWANRPEVEMPWGWAKIDCAECEADNYHAMRATNERRVLVSAARRAEKRLLALCDGAV